MVCTIRRQATNCFQGFVSLNFSDIKYRDLGNPEKRKHVIPDLLTEKRTKKKRNRLLFEELVLIGLLELTEIARQIFFCISSSADHRLPNDKT